MSRLVVITGANRGIGLALTRQLLERGDAVVAACRRPSPELTATGAEVVDGVDVTERAGLTRLDRALGQRGVDWLVCNAGVLQSQTLDSLDLDSMRLQYEVNALGPLRTVAALRHRLARGARVGIVTSRMGSIADNSSGGAYGYRMSKAAVNAAGMSLSHDLRPAGVAVALLHPGWVRTDMTGGRGLITADESAAGLIARLDDLRLESSGSFWHADGSQLPW